MKTGKLPIHPHDRARLLQFGDFVQPSKLPVIPKDYDATFGRIGQNEWDEDGNDNAGCCVVASSDHWIYAVKTAAGVPYKPSPVRVITEYSLQTGYKPGDPSTDNGTDPISFFNNWRQKGIFGETITTPGWFFGLPRKTITQNGDKIEAYVEVPKERDDLIAAAIYLFGGVVHGIQMPTDWQKYGLLGWSSAPTGLPDPAEGHMIMSAKYDAKGNLYPVTWGQQVLMGNAYKNTYTDVILVPLSADRLDPKTGKSPEGFDFGGLRDALAYVTA